MIRTRTITDANGEPVEIEIEDGLPEPKQDPINVIQAGLLIRHILAAKDERKDMPPAKPRKRKTKQKE